MGVPGLVLGWLCWLLGGGAACTEGVGVCWDQFASVKI